ncbi:MAG: M48 family metallopeptidase [Deltaproteobacteria bacterium]|nr:M48 family metallopeptidase [Deltaproteobacteria bacterium]
MKAEALRSAKERTLYVFALIVSIFAWLLVCITIVGLFYAPMIALFVVLGHALALARITGHSIRLGTRQLPELYRKVEKAAERLGLERVPEVYIVQGGGFLNAFATKLLSRNFVILNAEIVEACEKADEGKAADQPRAIDFVIGHEIGHLALGHLSWNWLLWPAQLVPLLGAAYSRAKEYSCDACGLAACEDLETSSRALAVLAGGGGVARQVNLDALMEQRHEAGGFIMALIELNSTHPFIAKRVAAIQELRRPGIAPDTGRNPFAYVLAPFFGAAAGGAASILQLYVIVCVIGILAAIAIPNFMKFQERAKAAQLEQLEGELGALGGAGDAAGNVFGNVGGDAQGAAANDLAALFAQAAQQAEQQGGQQQGLQAGLLGADDQPAEPARFEAKSWLKGQQALRNKEAVAALPTAKAIAFVDKLYKTGATNVYVVDVQNDDQGLFANAVTAELPSKPALRKKLVELCTAEYKKLGYEDPCVDEGQPELWFSWNE